MATGSTAFIGTSTDQDLAFYRNNSGARLTIGASATTIAGNFFNSSGGITFTSADPNIAGAWWDNAGTLTRSAG